MAKTTKDTERKLFGVRMDRALMVQLQHLATDQDKYVNELLEEAAKDLLKKYREKVK
ncbi:hypothetical protein [Nitrospira sp. BLG_1]|uniref:hypothetical protein n=1 Tax=Nitrospira sp. BLG_1 TaxID=3395883 RepID=UPI0039BC346E